MDLDCDGVVAPNEMQYFYEEQLHRMECMAQEPVLFEDIVCQMADMIGPEVCRADCVLPESEFLSMVDELLMNCCFCPLRRRAS